MGARIAWYHWFVRSVICILPSCTSFWVKRLVKKGIRYLMSSRMNPLMLLFIKFTSYSSSVSSERCSASIVWPISFVLLSVTLRVRLLFRRVVCLSAFKNFMSGIVDPPMTSMVKRTMMSVVVTTTWRFSSSKSRCIARA
uniref:Putative secreted protein n=1 Tax=Ixodes ricinus TaxID=34613 RepID=A0A6B0UTR0_IXORI